MLLLLESFDSFLELEEPRSGRWRSLPGPSRQDASLQAAGRMAARLHERDKKDCQVANGRRWAPSGRP